MCAQGVADGNIILNDVLPVEAWLDSRQARLPGVEPVDVSQWLLQSEVYAAQMAYRDRLIRTRRAVVYRCLPEAEAAAQEFSDLLGETVKTLPGFQKRGQWIWRADGVRVDMQADAPLIFAGQCVQEDFCLLMKFGDQHRLVGGVVCFPSGWNLAQKIGRAVTDIHTPVKAYAPVAQTVERMLSALRIEQPLGRANFLIYSDAELHQPYPEGWQKPLDSRPFRYVRVERQTFRRLPQSQAIVFGIHVAVVAAHQLSEVAYASLVALRPELVN